MVKLLSVIAFCFPSNVVCKLVTCDLGIFVNVPIYPYKADWRPATLTISKELSPIISCFIDNVLCESVTCNIGIASVFLT